MVCKKCTKKLGTVAAPDKWKDGARNTVDTQKKTGKLGANKLLQGKANRFDPTKDFKKCRVCKTKVHQPHAHYCQGCAYRIGICAMCGKQLADVKDQNQSST